MFFKDFGKAAFGYLTADLSGEPGTKVEWVVGEVVTDSRINRNPGGFRVFKQGSIILEKEKQHYELLFPPHVSPWENPNRILSPVDREITSFRYVEIEGDCTVLHVQRHDIFPECFSDDDSFFESSNENLNQILEFCKYSMKATAAFGIFIDGERERVPYEGDTYLNQLGWFACCANPEIPRKTIDYFEKHPTWPTEWRLLVPILVRDYWLYTGDCASIDRWLKWLPEHLLPSMQGPDGLLRGTKEIRDIVDWPDGERDGYEFGDVNFVPNAYFVRSLEAMAELTGDHNYSDQANRVRTELRKQMFRNGLPADHPGSLHTALHSALFALWSGITEPTEEMKHLILEKKMSCSVYAAQFLLEVCFSHGLQKHGFDLLTSRSLRSWNHMLEQGATITMEAWDDSLKPNQDWNHAWGAAPANIIPRYIAGIRPLAPGFSRFLVEPQPGPLEFFRCKHPTPKGPVIVEYHRQEPVKVTLPDGTVQTFRTSQAVFSL